jgi:Leucine-rich repeat (LRR) protein
MKTKIVFSAIALFSGLHSFCQNNQLVDSTKIYYNLNEAFVNPKKVKKLDLGYQQLNFDSIDFSEFVNLEFLSISHDGVQSMPKGIQELLNLQYLDLSSNNLKIIPIELLHLKNLQELYLNNDYSLNLEESLDILGKMPNLKRLHLDSIADINISPTNRPIYNIEFLSLRYNNLCNIPAFVSRFKNLKVLDLEGNKISTLEEDFLSNQKIEELSIGLADNFDLAKAFNVIKFMPELKTLHLDNTIIAKFPDDLSAVKNIQNLSLTNDHLKEFPIGLTTLENLKTLNLSGNDFDFLPIEFNRLNNLEELYLSNDFNLDIKESFEVLNSLPHLKILHLDNITTRKLPTNFKKLTHLETVYLQEGQFYMIPNQSHPIKKLSHVDLRNSSIPINGNNHNGFGLRLRW